MNVGVPTVAALAVSLFVTVSNAHADDLQRMQLATDLGSILASEELCGLEYDQDAIGAFIDEHVSADDMGFPSLLQMMTEGSAFQQQQLSKSAKAAHCRQIERIARSYNFSD